MINPTIWIMSYVTIMVDFIVFEISLIDCFLSLFREFIELEPLMSPSAIRSVSNVVTIKVYFRGCYLKYAHCRNQDNVRYEAIYMKITDILWCSPAIISIKSLTSSQYYVAFEI